MLDTRTKDRLKKSLTDSVSVFIFFILSSAHYFAQLMCTLSFKNYAIDNNLIKQLGLKAFII